MWRNRITRVLCISVILKDFPSVLEIAEQESNVYATVGVHPDAETDVEEGRSIEEPTLGRLLTLADRPCIVGIDETGLGYHHLDDRAVTDMEWQHDRSRTHIRASKQTNKLLMIHMHSSADGTLAIMREENAEAARGIIHCLTETWEMVKVALGLGSYISFSDIVMFKNAMDLRETVKKMPLDRMLVGIGSPRLTPVPFHGKTNGPAYVRHVGEFLATLRGEPLERIAGATTDNFFNLFNAIPR